MSAHSCVSTITPGWQTATVDSIFFLHDDGHLVQMRPELFSSESVLQTLLADHPHLLGGGDADHRLLLVGKEQGIPDDVDAPDRWSVDHLFVDPAGIPTLVEVKRSTDTRIRREVVGQMLDYAANGVRYWPQGSLRQYFEENVGGAEPARTLLAEFLHSSDDDAFWERVEDNLRSGRLRLVFVADTIPATLRRIIEFLNEQMDRTEVIGVEVQQYVGEGRTTIVPRVVGRTTAAQRNKPHGGTFEDDLAAAEQPVRDADRLLTEWASRTGMATRDTRRGRQFLTAEGAYLFQWYPFWSALEIPIQRLRSAGRDDLADEIRARVQALTPGRLSQKHLYLPARDIVTGWTTLEDEVIPAVISAVAQTQQHDAEERS